MTQVIFDVVDLVGEVHPGDTVSVWPPHVTATVDGRVQSTRKVDVLVDEGPVTEDIDPGPLVVKLQCRGIADTKPRTVTVPDEGTITLANLIQSTFTYTPAVVGQVALDAQRAEDAAVRAETGAASAEADRVVVEQAATSASWSGDRLTVLGSTSPPLTGPEGPEGPQGPTGDGTGDVLWSELNPVLDGKAPAAHNHHGDYYTKGQADGRYVSTSGSTTKTGNLNMDGGSVSYIRPDTTGGWARGFWWNDRDGTNLAGIGVYGNASDVQYFYLGHSAEAWAAPVFRAYQDRVSITNLEVTGAVTGIEADDVGAAPVTHTHTLADISGVPDAATAVNTGNTIATRNATGNLGVSTPTNPIHAANKQYVDGRTPEIRVVSTIPASPTPGVVYLRFG